MNCSICKTPTPGLSLVTVWIGERKLEVCEGCIEKAIAEMLRDIEQADKAYCQPCQHYTATGYCVKSLTPATCH
jgi:hypothetical protein